jgi:hypothetical protein
LINTIFFCIYLKVFPIFLEEAKKIHNKILLQMAKLRAQQASNQLAAAISDLHQTQAQADRAASLAASAAANAAKIAAQIAAEGAASAGAGAHGGSGGHGGDAGGHGGWKK